MRCRPVITFRAQTDAIAVRTRWVDYKDHEFDPYVRLSCTPWTDN